MKAKRKNNVPLSYYIDRQLADDLHELATEWEIPKSQILRASLEIFLKRNLKKVKKS